MSDAQPQPRDVVRRAARGAGVATAVAAASRLLLLAQQLILARLLAADAFGQFAFATLVIGLPALLVNLRGSDAIVQSADDEEGVRRLTDTAFTAQLLLAVPMMIALVAGSSLIAGVAGKPYLAALLIPLAVLVLSATGGPSSNTGPLLLPIAGMERRLDFVRARLPELANVVVNTAVAIGLALAGLGVWSLAAGLIAGSAVHVILAWRLATLRPRLGIDRAMLSRLLRFGGPLYLSYLLSWGYLNADNYFVGSFLGERQLGLYYMAFNISQVPLQVRFILSRVAFPAFARAREDHAFLSRLYAGVTRYAMAAAGGVCALGIGLARPAVVLLLGSSWLPAVPALQILFLSTLLRTGLGFNGELLTSLGKTGTVLACTAAALATLLVAGPLMMLRWGIPGMAWAVCLSSLATAALSSIVIRRHVAVGYARELGPALLCLAAVAGAGLALAGQVDTLGKLVLAGLALGAAYAGLYLGLFDRPAARWVLSRLKKEWPARA